MSPDNPLFLADATGSKLSQGIFGFRKETIKMTVAYAQLLPPGFAEPLKQISIRERTWEDDRGFKNFQELHRQFNAAVRDAIQSGIAEVIHPQTPDEPVIEFGTGEGLSHPFFEENSLIAIEPNTEALQNGIKSGRIKNSVVHHIKESKPPYPIHLDWGVPAGAFAVSVFHVFPKVTQLTDALLFVGEKLPSGTSIVHIQHTPPSYAIFPSLTETDIGEINAYFLNRYPKFAHANTPTVKLLQNYFETYYQEVKSLTFPTMRKEQQMSFPKHPFQKEKNSLEQSIAYLRSIQIPTVSSNTMLPIQSLATALIDANSNISSKNIENPLFENRVAALNATLFLDMINTVFLQDMFESVAVIAMQRAGLIPKADRVLRVIPNSPLSINVDGMKATLDQKKFLPHEWNQGGTFGSVRRIVGQKP